MNPQPMMMLLVVIVMVGSRHDGVGRVVDVDVVVGIVVVGVGHQTQRYSVVVIAIADGQFAQSAAILDIRDDNGSSHVDIADGFVAQGGKNR